MLAEIIKYKREELAQRRVARPLADVKAACADAEPARTFASRLRRGSGPLKLLAEVKRGSPSQGLIHPDADPAGIARVYAECGAAAISVLTDERYFRGRDSHVAQIKAAVDLPVLRKDFTLDAYHVYEARSIDADAVLLMAQVLSAGELADLLALTRSLGMEALVECHEPEEMERVLDAGATAIGINNRDLWTLQIDMDTTLRLLPLVPEGKVAGAEGHPGAKVAGAEGHPEPKVLVSQSGMTERRHVARLEATRVDAIQVGTSLMASGNAQAKIRELMGQTP